MIYIIRGESVKNKKKHLGRGPASDAFDFKKPAVSVNRIIVLESKPKRKFNIFNWLCR